MPVVQSVTMNEGGLLASHPALDNPAGLPDLRTAPALPVLVRVTAPADRPAVVPALVSVSDGVLEEIPELEIAAGETAFILFGFWRHEQGRLSGSETETVAAAPEGAVVHDRRTELEHRLLVRGPLAGVTERGWAVPKEPAAEDPRHGS